MTAFGVLPGGSEARTIRQGLGHPVIDADGHLIPFRPLLDDLLREIAGVDIATRFTTYLGSRPRSVHGFLPVRTFHRAPAENTLDRMSVTLPQLHYDRLAELGIDYALLYPTGLQALTCPDDEVRQAAARAYNEYVAAVYSGYRDRLEPVASIPTFTPEEAIAELDHAVGTLGLKAIVLSGAIPRTVLLPDGTVTWVDSLGHGSLYNYDPFWQRCLELRVVPTFHGIGYGWGSRMSANNYVYNHLGSFATAQEAVCRSLIMGGVPVRFPDLRFAFLEGGVAWASQLLSDLLGHYDKRNREAVVQFDPARLDLSRARQLFAAYARGRMADYDTPAAFVNPGGAPSNNTPDDIDDFAESGIRSAAAIEDMFCRQFFFGCEADDPLNGLAFDDRYLPKGVHLNAMFASDVGHWDVPDMRMVLPEAWELVEHGLLDRLAFEQFTATNVGRMLTDVNPTFFDGTAVAGAVR
jgi:predicted TIM-barrel fold metal-dependent hydrolase